MIELIPLFAHGAAGMGMFYLIIVTGGSLALGTITVLVTAAITKKWNRGTLLIWLLSIIAWWVPVYLIIVNIDQILRLPHQLQWYLVFGVVASLVMGAITAAVITRKKKWSWGICLLSVIAWAVILFLVIYV